MESLLYTTFELMSNTALTLNYIYLINDFQSSNDFFNVFLKGMENTPTNHFDKNSGTIVDRLHSFLIFCILSNDKTVVLAWQWEMWYGIYLIFRRFWNYSTCLCACSYFSTFLFVLSPVHVFISCLVSSGPLQKWVETTSWFKLNFIYNINVYSLSIFTICWSVWIKAEGTPVKSCNCNVFQKREKNFCNMNPGDTEQIWNKVFWKSGKKY